MARACERALDARSPADTPLGYNPKPHGPAAGLRALHLVRALRIVHVVHLAYSHAHSCIPCIPCILCISCIPCISCTLMHLMHSRVITVHLAYFQHLSHTFSTFQCISAPFSASQCIPCHLRGTEGHRRIPANCCRSACISKGIYITPGQRPAEGHLEPARPGRGGALQVITHKITHKITHMLELPCG